jgi:predicted solute-binding protein
MENTNTMKLSFILTIAIITTVNTFAVAKTNERNTSSKNVVSQISVDHQIINSAATIVGKSLEPSSVSKTTPSPWISGKKISPARKVTLRKRDEKWYC